MENPELVSGHLRQCLGIERMANTVLSWEVKAHFMMDLR